MYIYISHAAKNPYRDLYVNDGSVISIKESNHSEHQYLYLFNV